MHVKLVRNALRTRYSRARLDWRLYYFMYFHFFVVSPSPNNFCQWFDRSRTFQHQPKQNTNFNVSARPWRWWRTFFFNSDNLLFENTFGRRHWIGVIGVAIVKYIRNSFGGWFSRLHWPKTEKVLHTLCGTRVKYLTRSNMCFGRKFSIPDNDRCKRGRFVTAKTSVVCCLFCQLVRIVSPAYGY